LHINGYLSGIGWITQILFNITAMSCLSFQIPNDQAGCAFTFIFDDLEHFIFNEINNYLLDFINFSGEFLIISFVFIKGFTTDFAGFTCLSYIPFMEIKCFE